jgi:LysM repeat protein
MNNMDATIVRTKTVEEATAPSGKKITMSPLAISMLVALQFLWFFILGGVFYGYIDTQKSLKSIQDELSQTDKNLSVLAAQISRVEASAKTANKKISPLSISAAKNNVAALTPANGLSQSSSAGDPQVDQMPPAEMESKQPATSPAWEILRHTEQYHRVNAGETLYKISQRYKISIAEINQLNNLKQDQPILPGQKLLVSPVKY